MTHRIVSGVVWVACLFASGIFAGCESLCPPPVVVTVQHPSASSVTLPGSIVIVEPLVVDNVLPGTVQPFDQRYGEYLSGQTVKCVGQMCGLSVKRSDVMATTLPVGRPVQPIGSEMTPSQEDSLVTTRPVAPSLCPPGTVRIGGKVEIYVTDVFGSGPIEKWNGTTVTLTAAPQAIARGTPTTQPTTDVRTPTTRAAAFTDVRPLRRFIRVSASYLIQTGPRCPGILVQVWTPQCELTNTLRMPLKQRACDKVSGKEAQADSSVDMAALQEMAIRCMLDSCAQQLCMILQAHDQQANLTLRPTLQPHGAIGIKRLQAGNYVNAVHQLETAVHTEPDDGNLHFDLAVADEAAGYLSAAWQHYREAFNLNGRTDRDAAMGAQRMERLLQREDYLRQLALAMEQANQREPK